MLSNGGEGVSGATMWVPFMSAPHAVLAGALPQTPLGELKAERNGGEGAKRKWVRDKRDSGRMKGSLES